MNTRHAMSFYQIWRVCLMTTPLSHPTTAPLSLAPTSGGRAASPTLAINETIAARRAAGRRVIHLGFGEASFPLHPILRAALADHATKTSYAPVLGIPALRQAIAGYLSRTRGLHLSAAQIAVGPGSKPLLYALMQVLAGDLLLPAPSWVSYAPHARLAGRRVIAVETDAGDHHRLAPQTLSATLERARSDGADPRILLVNSPSNPTGGMFERADVEAIALWAREQGITIISDEIYAELAHGWRAHVSPAAFYPEGTIVTGGLSKAFSAGGWRLGYAALPATDAGEQVMAALRALASEIWSSTPTPVQEAAVLAYSPNADLESYVRRSARLHGYIAGRLHQTLTSLGVLCARPAGAFYLYPDFAPWRAALAARGAATSDGLARLLLDEWDIAALPGEAFSEPPEALRLRVATSLLCVPDANSPEEREATLWDVLERADDLPADDPAAGDLPPMAALERAQIGLAAFVASLGEPTE
ncbi:MAG TPA: aminotransferase class I/II-fold pyridoxal phosphate-dependent enzyme [Ktedonobacterales bacterium]|nr:aminotransferase class I/II-fold pyridoxal phosphate-dependent enzyme [Ktedonobacterales bacterium]